MSSRELILGRVRRALEGCADVTEPAGVRNYLREHGDRTAAENVEILAANLADYRAIVHRTDTGTLPALIGTLLVHARRVVIPFDLPVAYLADLAAAAIVREAAEDTPADLDRADAVVTGCALAVAETGTVVLDGGTGQGRRRITLIPDRHICIVRVPDQVVASVPHALARLAPARPLTWISGPSATSDIELDRVEGVHGPRCLDIILVAPTPPR
jgi:L-lactate dehydrogenase complex protein LldG